MRHSARFLVVLLVVLLGVAVGCRRGDDSTQDDTRSPADQQVPTGTASIEGVIELPRGVDRAGVMVFAEGTSHLTLTNSLGEFTLTGLPPGIFTLRAFRGDLTPLELGDLLVTADDIRRAQPFQDVGGFLMNSVDTMSASVRAGARSFGTVNGRVVTANPLDLEGVVVELQGTGFRTVTDHTGTFQLLNVPTDDYLLRARRSGYTPASLQIEVLAGQTIDIGTMNLRMQNVGEVIGRAIVGRVMVYDAAENLVTPPPPVTVMLEGTALSTRVDPTTGRFQFTDLSDGVYLVAAEAEGYMLEQRFRVNLEQVETAEVTLTLRSDEPPLTPGGSLAGEVVLEDADENGNAGISISLAGTDIMGTTDGSGFFMLEEVPPGTYTLTAAFPGYKPGRLTQLLIREGGETIAPPLTLESDVVRPRVIASNPRQNETDVSIQETSAVVIEFNQKMDTDSLRRAVTVTPDVSWRFARAGEHPQSSEDRLVLLMSGYSRDGGNVLRYNTRYTITIAKSASNVEGVTMRDDHNLSFTTGSAKIIATNPADDSRGAFVYLTHPVRVYFNANIREDSISANDIDISPSLPGTPTVYIQDDPRTGWSYLSIGGLFNFDTEYTIRVRGRPRTLAGDRVSNVPYTFTFRTTERWEGLSRFPERDRDREREERLRR